MAREKATLSESSNMYRTNPKYLDTRKIAVFILKFEQCGSTIEQ